MKTEEINKLYNDGKISITEADKLRKGEVDEAVRTKNNEISELYVKGGLSISDTIAADTIAASVLSLKGVLRNAKGESGSDSRATNAPRVAKDGA